VSLPQPDLPPPRPLLRFALDFLDTLRPFRACDATTVDIVKTVLESSLPSVSARVGCPDPALFISPRAQSTGRLRFAVSLKMAAEAVAEVTRVLNRSACFAGASRASRVTDKNDAILHAESTVDTTLAGCDEVARDTSLPAIGEGIASMLAHSGTVSLYAFSQTTWLRETGSPSDGYADGAGYRESVMREVPQCVAPGGRDGSPARLAALRIAPDAAAVVFGGNVQFQPEDHASPQPLFRSQAHADDPFPIPHGCFRDVSETGTPSDPALVTGGQYYELTGAECVGNRTQEDMLRICLTIIIVPAQGG